MKSRFSYLSYRHPFLVGVLNQHMSNLCCIVKISQRNNKTRPRSVLEELVIILNLIIDLALTRKKEKEKDEGICCRRS